MRRARDLAAPPRCPPRISTASPRIPPHLQVRDEPREPDEPDGAPCLSPSPSGVALLLEVLRLADFWDMAHLKESCEALAVRWEVLQVENCCALYEHAASLHCAQLRVACIQYIRDMFDAVSLSDGWAALSEEMRRPIVELGKPKAPARAVSCEGRR